MTDTMRPFSAAAMTVDAQGVGLALDFDGVTFAYRDTPALDDFSARLEPGKLTCIVGKNGSGKSTLIALADGLLRPAAGRMLLGDKDMAQMNSRERARLLAVLFQQNATPAATVEELVAHGRYPHTRGVRLDEEDVAAVEAALLRLELGNLRHRLVAQLSGGQRQRAFLAMVLAQDAPVVLLDEPTAALDAHAAHDVMQLAAELSQEGKTVGVVIHDLDLALRYANCLLIMDEGRLVAAGTREEIIEADVIPGVFGMRTVACEDAATGETGFLLFPLDAR